MGEVEKIPQIKELFKDENLCVQNVYKSKEKYNVVYINPKVYEEIFKEKYEWEIAKQKISEMFSITLDEEKSNKQVVGEAFSDKQFDPLGIALSGNLGSGRAYFYGSMFNIKGDKTKLATSPNSNYNNGKFALSAAIKETIITNILSEDFVIPTFKTLALLEKKERFDFVGQYLDSDDVIKQEIYNLPCAIEVRVNNKNELYRVSNSLINEDTYTISKLESFCESLAKIEANKFCDRFLHGSWSVGNISTNGNLIDFDTATFVKGRFPQYSNTNKYKSNYFGYELLGQKLMVKSILENITNKFETNTFKEFEEIENNSNFENALENLIDKRYYEYLTIKFCNLIGLDYEIYYKKYNKYIDNLCKKFNELSRKFLPNYYETNVVEEYGDSTYFFDFSNFFQKYLIEKEKNKSNILLGLNLLLNKVELISYNKVGMIKRKIDGFFEQNLVYEFNKDSLILEAIDFVDEYDKLFIKISEENDLSKIKLKQYIINANRNYIYANEKIYGNIAYLYDIGKIDSKTLNSIINALIKANMRNNYSANKENIIGLELYEDCLTYFVVALNYYYLVIEPFSNFKIEFAKIIINDEELMVKHSNDENGNIMISEKVYFENLENILGFDVVLKINGKEYKKHWNSEK